MTRRKIGAQQAFNRFGAIFGRGTVADLAGDGGVLADGATDAEVERVDHLAVLLDLLPLEANVCDPALAAGVGAAGDMQLDLLVEAGQPLFHLAGEPLTGETPWFP